jgi:hypothetical protein
MLLERARRSVTIAVAQDLALDVAARWTAGRMGRWRWLLLGPLTAVLALAAVNDVANAEPGLDTAGRIATACVMSALFLNVAAKRLRDLRLGGWAGALGMAAAVTAAHLAPVPVAIALIACATVLFLFPSAAPRA